MPRPPLPLGTWGEIRTHATAFDDKGEPSRFRAVTNYRDFDGRTRQVERHGKTKNAATNALRTALKERTTIGRQGDLTGTSRFGDAAQLWIDKFAVLVKEERRSPGSLETYRRHLDLHVLPALRELRLREITTPLLDKYIAKVKTGTGPSTAKTCRSIVSGVMGLAVRYGAIVANPIREVETVESRTKKQPRALTDAERAAWRARLEADDQAVRKDLPDLTDFMLATGVRIGEALAVIWSEVDLEHETVEITSTIVRVTGEGLVRKPTKSRAGQRILGLPSWAAALLRRRFMANPHLEQPVFPDGIGGFRDPSNTRRDLRTARGTDEFAWITSHNFRKTTATVLDDAGLSSRRVADQLGHARPSMTQDVYMGRKVNDRQAADALERALGSRSGESKG